MPSHTGTAAQTKAFIYKADSNRRRVGPQSNTPTTRHHPKLEDQYPGSSTGGPSPYWGMWAKTAPPRVGHPQGARSSLKSTPSWPLRKSKGTYLILGLHGCYIHSTLFLCIRQVVNSPLHPGHAQSHGHGWTHKGV